MRLTTASLGLSSDAGEVASLTQKLVEYGRDVDLLQLKEEVGDCLWRLAQISDAAGFSLGEAMEANIRKLNARYRGGYSDEAANNRDKDAEAKAMRRVGKEEADKLAADHDKVMGLINEKKLAEYERERGYPPGSLTTKSEPSAVEQDGHGFGHIGPSEFLDDDPKPKDY